MASRESQERGIVLEGKALRVVLDVETGAFASIKNKAAGLELVTQCPAEPKPPWVLGFTRVPGGKPFNHEVDESRQFDSFKWKRLAECQGVLLEWKTTEGPTVEMKVMLRGATAEWPERVDIWAEADNPTGRVLQTLNAPYVEGIGRLGNEEEARLNRLAHSAHSGFLVDDPVGLMHEPFAPGEPLFEFWPMRYPNGFHAPMQFFSYYVERRGGFYFAAHDPHHSAKCIDFKKEAGGQVVISTPNYQWVERGGEAMRLRYPYVIAPLTRGDWYEGAELYRKWVTGSDVESPTWTRRGRIEDRAKRGDWASWLSDGVAVCTFGLPASYDVSPWLRAIDAAAGGPVFHVFGHDWPAYAPVFVEGKEYDALAAECGCLWARWRPVGPAQAGQFGYWGGRLSEEEWHDDSAVKDMLAKAGLPNGRGDVETARALRRANAALQEFRRRYDTGMTGAEVDNYFPTRLTPENEEACAENKDPKAPFHFDYFPHGLDVEKLGLLTRERAEKVDKDAARFLHPASEFFRDFHARRSAAIVERGGFEALYYDISASSGGEYSDRSDFGIPAGAGRKLIEAHRRLFAETREQACRAGGRYVPQGTEVMIENFLDVVDYGQWRVGGGVHGDMEGENLVPFVKAGRARRIPMWTYVYHEFGGVRMDGWTKLSKNFGELFFHTAAQIAVEGQILEVNYEFSPLESFPGIDRPSPQLVYLNQVRLDNDVPEVDPEKLAWLGEATAARTGFAKDYLAWGRMVPPGKVSGGAEDVEFDWWHYNDIDGREEKGTLRVPSVVHAAWAYRDERVGLVFVNILGKRKQTVNVEFDLAVAGVKGGLVRGRRATRDEKRHLPVEFGEGSARFELTLPPRKIVLVELTQ